MSLEEWKQRYTPRIFDNTSKVPDQDLEELIELVKYIPSQNGKHQHTWVVLTEKHKHVKKWLIENIFYLYDNQVQIGLPAGEKEHMIQIYTAPVVFCAFYEPEGSMSFQSEVYRAIGLHSAAIGQKALTQGHDIAFLGCIAQTKDHDDHDRILKTLNEESLNYLKKKDFKNLPRAVQDHEIMKRGFTEILVQNFEKQLRELYRNKTFFNFYPGLCLCIGKGLEIPENIHHFATYDGYTYRQTQKRKKDIHNIIY